MDDKLAADEARRSVQHESVKAQVEGEVQAEIADRAQVRRPVKRRRLTRSRESFARRLSMKWSTRSAKLSAAAAPLEFRRSSTTFSM